MKLALVGINSKYTHSNLAIKYLKEDIKDVEEALCIDFSINDQKERILHYLIENSFTHIGFSVYIWNVDYVMELIEDLKTIDETIQIIVGGPEVSYDSYEFMEKVAADYLLAGDGEGLLKSLIISLKEESEIDHPSIIYRKDGELFGRGLINRSDKLLSIYTNDKFIEKDRYVYYEASRGCPYNCAFCLSSIEDKIIFKDSDLVKKELGVFLDKKVKIVKFIDRSFNFNPAYLEIMNFLKDNDNGVTTFHMEIHPSLINDNFIDLVKSSRDDLFQFEIGLQTTNEKTAQEIARAGSFKEIEDTCLRLNESDAHVHMDLIAGLPFEGLASFKKSFNDLYTIGPEKIQLGFLKLLKGSRLRIDKQKYGYKHFAKAPYEVISNKWLSYKDIIHIKGVEDMVERYYNEAYFARTISFMIEEYYPSPWDFFQDLADFWKKKGILYTPVSRIKLFNYLDDFLDPNWDIKYIRELLIYDYYMAGNNRSSKFKLYNYHKSYDNSYVLDLIKENDAKIKQAGHDSKHILKKSIIEIFPIGEDLSYNGKDNYHLFIREGNKLVNIVLEEDKI